MEKKTDECTDLPLEYSGAPTKVAGVADALGICSGCPYRLLLLAIVGIVGTDLNGGARKDAAEDVVAFVVCGNGRSSDAALLLGGMDTGADKLFRINRNMADRPWCV